MQTDSSTICIEINRNASFFFFLFSFFFDLLYIKKCPPPFLCNDYLHVSIITECIDHFRLFSFWSLKISSCLSSWVDTYVLWFRHFLEEILNKQFLKNFPQNMRADNQGAISSAKNCVPSERNKHTELGHFFLREKIEEKLLTCVPSGANIADRLTKSVQQFKKKKRNTPIYFNTNYRTEMKLVPPPMQTHP